MEPEPPLHPESPESRKPTTQHNVAEWLLWFADRADSIGMSDVAHELRTRVAVKDFVLEHPPIDADRRTELVFHLLGRVQDALGQAHLVGPQTPIITIDNAGSESEEGVARSDALNALYAMLGLPDSAFQSGRANDYRLRTLTTPSGITLQEAVVRRADGTTRLSVSVLPRAMNQHP